MCKWIDTYRIGFKFVKALKAGNNGKVLIF